MRTDAQDFSPTLVALAALLEALPSETHRISFAEMLIDATRALVNDGTCITLVMHAPEEGVETVRIGLHSLNATEIEVFETLETLLERMRKEQRWALAAAKAHGGVH